MHSAPQASFEAPHASFVPQSTTSLKTSSRITPVTDATHSGGALGERRVALPQSMRCWQSAAHPSRAVSIDTGPVLSPPPQGQQRRGERDPESVEILAAMILARGGGARRDRHHRSAGGGCGGLRRLDRRLTFAVRG
ncbi:MAG: hypothetical protein IPH44_41215 [Myxococcales bacterium]|nr:hypothetical protein [Myxococcales bacterium]